MDSDLSTFRSSLVREAQPDFVITVGSYRWTVHAKKLQKSSFFHKLISTNQSPASRNVVLPYDDPIVIGHLILWLYTGQYMDNSTENGNTPAKSLDINDIMKNGKVDEPGSPLLGSPASAVFCQQDEEWDIPDALHAKMFIIAEKYSIGELLTKSINELRQELEWNADVMFLPILKELFSGGKSPTTTSSTTTRESNATSGLHEKDYNFTPLPGSEMFDLLAGTASKAECVNKYLDSPDFQNVLVENPSFQLEILRRVAGDLEEKQVALDKMEEEFKSPKPKKGRKKRGPTESVERGDLKRTKSTSMDSMETSKT